MLPTDVAGIQYWYHAGAVTLNGTAVVSAIDQSGTNDPNKTATQPNPAFQPIINLADTNYNNQPTITTTGSQRLQTGTFAAPLVQPTTRFFVGHTTVAGQNCAWMDSTAGTYALEDGSGNINLYDGAAVSTFITSLNTPRIIVVVDNGASSNIAVSQVAPNVAGNAGTNGALALILGNANGYAQSLRGPWAEQFGYSGLLTALQIANLTGYLQQKFGIAVLGSTIAASIPGPTLSDLRFAGQSLADRVNASTITPAEWNIWVNDGVQELYGFLTGTYQDYNVKQTTFTLAGTSAANTLYVGQAPSPPGAPVVTDFFLPRGLWKQVATQGSSPYYATVPRLNSLFERNLHIGPSINPLYGQMATFWNIIGNALEVLPPDSSAGNYLLTYVPRMPKLVVDTDSIAPYWLSINGWDQYVRKYVAIQALVKEESLDTAAYLRAELGTLRERILREAAPRDDSQPGKITDVKRVNANYGFGSGAGGWGF